MAGDFFNRGGKWFVTVPDQKSIEGLERGPFDTREEAAKVYMAEIDRLYPLPPPPHVDPAKHHSLAAADITTNPLKID
jgi:hypothetical protein